MKNIKIKYLKFLFSAALIVFLLNFIDLSQLSDLRVDIIIYFFIGVIITLSSLVMMSVRYNLMLKEFSSVFIKTSLVFKYYMIGMFFNIFMPGAIGGDVVRIQQIKKNHDISLKKISLITFSERLAGVYGLIFLLALSLIFRNYPNAINLNLYFPVFLTNILPLALLLIIPLTKFLLAKRDIKFTYLFVFKTLVVLLSAQMGDVLIAFIFSNYLNLEVSFFSYLFIMPIVYIATVVPISFGGLGVREGVFAGILAMYGVSISDAVLLSILMYFIKIIVGLIGYVIYLTHKDENFDKN